MSIPTSKSDAIKSFMADVQRLKNKAALLEQQKIPVDEFFKDLALHEQFWVGVIEGYVEEQLERIEGYKRVLERVQSLRERLVKKIPSSEIPAPVSVNFSEPKDRPDDEGY